MELTSCVVLKQKEAETLKKKDRLTGGWRGWVQLAGFHQSFSSYCMFQSPTRRDLSAVFTQHEIC